MLCPKVRLENSRGIGTRSHDVCAGPAAARWLLPNNDIKKCWSGRGDGGGGRRCGAIGVPCLQEYLIGKDDEVRA